MLRRLTTVLFCIGLSHASAAGLWPDRFSDYTKTSSSAIAVEDKSVWDEYGLEAAEKADYTGPGGKFHAEAFRLKDPTSALAIYQWRRPTDAKPSDLRKVAVETSTGAWMILGNYYVSFEGRRPTVTEIQELFVLLPRMDQAALPTLADFLPSQNLVPGSERYVIGPAAMAKFEPRIPPSVAAFSMGAEAQLGRFRSPAGELNLAIFSYPTPQIARERLAEFQKLPNAMAKRSTTLVAVTFQPPNADEAEKLLAKVNYRANVTWNEQPEEQKMSVASLLINIFVLVGVLIGFTLVGGLGYAAIRLGWRKWAGETAGDSGVLTLHLEDK